MNVAYKMWCVCICARMLINNSKVYPCAFHKELYRGSMDRYILSFASEWMQLQ